jgi:predicted small secreted protein
MRTLLIAILLTTPLLAASCNTIEGIGKDVQAAGKAVADAAEDKK